MDKFDIHKWQRQALIEEKTLYNVEILDFTKKFETDWELERELDDSFTKLDNFLKQMSLDDPQNQYLTRQLAHKYNSMLYESGKLEEAGNDERMKDLILAIRPIAKNFIEFAKKKGKLKELEAALTTAETELNIDIPDSPEEASGISKSELESIGRVKNLIGDQELGENLEDLEKKVRNLLAGSGLLITTLGALAKVSKVAGALDMTGVGIFFMAVSMLLTHYKNRKDESINEFGIEEKPDDWTPTCPKCYNKLLVPDIFGYSICLLCGFVNIGN